MIAEEIKEKIAEWLREESPDFAMGISLLRLVNRNTYYIRNIERAKRLSTLKYELGKVISLFLASSTPKAWQVPEDGKMPHPIPTPKERGKDATQLTHPHAKSVAISGGEYKTEESERIVIRKEFPFLSEKDCPDELKILVADMITAHSRYVAAHERLFEVAHKGEGVCFETANEVIENYLENRKIWEELEYYKKHGKVLGEHQIFESGRKEKQMALMDLEGLKKSAKNIKRSIDYRKKLLQNKEAEVDGLRLRVEIRGLEDEYSKIKRRIEHYGKGVKRVGQKPKGRDTEKG